MQNLKDGKLPQNEVFWSDLNTWTEVRLVCWEDLHRENSDMEDILSLFSVWWTLGLPVTSITVGVTVIVPDQVRMRSPLRGADYTLTLETIFVPLPVKILHISHVQSKGRVVEVKLDDSFTRISQRMQNTAESWERFDTILDCRKNLGLCYVTERQKLYLDVAGVS